MIRTSTFLIFAVTLLAPFHLNAKDNPTLKVYAHASFVGKWGPGPKLKELFEKDCHCKVDFAGQDSVGATLARLKREGKDAKADVLIGLDAISLPDALSSNLLCKLNPSEQTDEPRSKELDAQGHLYAYDYGFFTFMYDERKIPKPPTSVRELLSSKEFNKKVLVEDPRTSAPGLYLLSYLKAVYGKDFKKGLGEMKDKTLTTTKGWSEAYGLFTKGEAPIVWSYTTSEAYHLEIDKVSHFKGMRFSEGHPIQIEGAGLARSACENLEQRKLGVAFLRFLQSIPAQKIIAESNWMYPVKGLDALSYKTFQSLAVPAKILAAENQNDRKSLLNSWLQVFAKN